MNSNGAQMASERKWLALIFFFFFVNVTIDNIKKKIKIATRSRKHEDTRRHIACPWNPLSLVIAAA